MGCCVSGKDSVLNERLDESEMELLRINSVTYTELLNIYYSIGPPLSFKKLFIRAGCDVNTPFAKMCFQGAVCGGQHISQRQFFIYMWNICTMDESHIRKSYTRRSKLVGSDCLCMPHAASFVFHMYDPDCTGYIPPGTLATLSMDMYGRNFSVSGKE